MKVILLAELKGRGGEGDVIDVAQGFAVNYLLPRKMAIQATSGNLKQLEQRRHNIAKREEDRFGDAEKLRAALESKAVTVEAKVGEEGRLFGSVTSPMIEEAIRAQLGIEVDRRKIETHGHIKVAGPHVIDVAIYRDVKAQITVDVVPEGGAHEHAVSEVEGVTDEGAAFVELVEAESDTEAVEAPEDEVVIEDSAEAVAEDVTEAEEALEAE